MANEAEVLDPEQEIRMKSCLDRENLVLAKEEDVVKKLRDLKLPSDEEVEKRYAPVSPWNSVYAEIVVKVLICSHRVLEDAGFCVLGNSTRVAV